MKFYCLLLSLFCLLACNSPSEKKISKPDSVIGQKPIVQTIPSDTAPKYPSPDLTTRVDENKTTTDTVRINRQTLVIHYNHRDWVWGATTLKGDTIIEFKDGYQNMHFNDVNGDGIKDIRLSQDANYPKYDTYLFDPKQKKFRYVDGCMYEIVRIGATSYFYSYTKAGCADLNWVSYLSKLDNYKWINIAYIYGKGCDTHLETSSPDIYIYKIRKGKEIPYKTLPYQKYIPEPGAKWDFIDRYWKKNYQQNGTCSLDIFHK